MDSADVGRIGECPSCHRAVRYVVTVLGSIIPLDVTPHPEGYVAMVPTPNGARAKVFGGSRGMPDRDTTMWMDHRSVCARREEARQAERAAAPEPQPGKRCAACMLPMDPVLSAAGDLYHPCCSGHPHHMAPTYIEGEEDGAIQQESYRVQTVQASEGEQRKAVGMEQALSSPAGQEWADRAWRILAGLAKAGQPFTVEDVTARIDLPNPTGINANNAVGALMSRASKSGLLEAQGWQPSTRPESHARPIRIWRGTS